VTSHQRHNLETNGLVLQTSISPPSEHKITLGDHEPKLKGRQWSVKAASQIAPFDRAISTRQPAIGPNIGVEQDQRRAVQGLNREDHRKRRHEALQQRDLVLREAIATTPDATDRLPRAIGERQQSEILRRSLGPKIGENGELPRFRRHIEADANAAPTVDDRHRAVLQSLQVHLPSALGDRLAGLPEAASGIDLRVDRVDPGGQSRDIDAGAQQFAGEPVDEGEGSRYFTPSVWSQARTDEVMSAMADALPARPPDWLCAPSIVSLMVSHYRIFRWNWFGVVMRGLVPRIPLRLAMACILIEMAGTSPASIPAESAIGPVQEHSTASHATLWRNAQLQGCLRRPKGSGGS
jgi:hypothetical protein